MKKKMKKLFTYALVFIASACFTGLYSCKKDKEETSTAVELHAFGYAGAKPGEPIQVIGNNLQKVTAVEFSDGTSVIASAFVEHTEERIVVTVPIDASPGPITLKTPEGNVTSKSPLNLLVEVEVTSFTSQVIRGGVVTVQGDYLNWISDLTITGTNSSDRVRVFVSKSRTELKFVTPEWLAPGNYSITFACKGTEPRNLTPAAQLTVIH